MAGEAVDAAEVQLAEATPKVTTAALKDQAPGLFGVSYADWGSLLAALIALWVFVALFFWLLINVAVKMRGNDYKVLPYEFIGSEFAHTCADRDYGKLPCPQKSYSAARNLYPWIEFACNKQIHGIFNVAYNNLCTEMLEGFEQYYLASNA